MEGLLSTRPTPPSLMTDDLYLKSLKESHAKSVKGRTLELHQVRYNIKVSSCHLSCLHPNLNICKRREELKTDYHKTC